MRGEATSSMFRSLRVPGRVVAAGLHPSQLAARLKGDRPNDAGAEMAASSHEFTPAGEDQLGVQRGVEPVGAQREAIVPLHQGRLPAG